MALPGITSDIKDGNLNPIIQQTAIDQSVIVIGTAEDGEMYEPKTIQRITDGESYFGSLNKGNLVRGIHEVFNNSAGSPNIRAMRIGNGQKALIELSEQTGTGVKTSTSGATALTITAKYPGSIYNDISIGYDEHMNVAIYNPKSKSWTTFTWDTDETNNSVDVHNVQELADAINADTNLSAIVLAEVVPIDAAFELKVTNSSS